MGSTSSQLCHRSQLQEVYYMKISDVGSYVMGINQELSVLRSFIPTWYSLDVLNDLHTRKNISAYEYIPAKGIEEGTQV